MINKTSCSPIEKMFWQAWEYIEHEACLRSVIPLISEYPIGRYRVDFACPPIQIAIELDGHVTHSSPDAIAYDRKRQREIESTGWRVIRFGGKEITSNAWECAREAFGLIFQAWSTQQFCSGCGSPLSKEESCNSFLCECC
jgi:very-short-patch-repair endonuclease